MFSISEQHKYTQIQKSEKLPDSPRQGKKSIHIHRPTGQIYFYRAAGGIETSKTHHRFYNLVDTFGVSPKKLLVTFKTIQLRLTNALENPLWQIGRIQPKPGELRFSSRWPRSVQFSDSLFSSQNHCSGSASFQLPPPVWGRETAPLRSTPLRRFTSPDRLRQLPALSVWPISGIPWVLSPPLALPRSLKRGGQNSRFEWLYNSRA